MPPCSSRFSASRNGAREANVGSGGAPGYASTTWSLTELEPMSSTASRMLRLYPSGGKGTQSLTPVIAETTLLPSPGRVELDHGVRVSVLRAQGRSASPHPDAVDLDAVPELGHRHRPDAPGLRVAGPDADAGEPVQARHQEATDVRQERSRDGLLGELVGAVLVHDV